MRWATHIRIGFTQSHVLHSCTLATLRAFDVVCWQVSIHSSQPDCLPCVIIPYAFMRNMAFSTSFIQ